MNNTLSRTDDSACCKGRVAVIDDDPVIRDALSRVLMHEGYSCDLYASATEYLETATTPPGKDPYCVLCDIVMPEMNGLQLQRHLTETSQIPLVMVSGMSGVNEVVDAFRAGAIDFLVKPVNPNDLLNAIEKAISVSKARLRREKTRTELAKRIAHLTKREHQVAQQVAAGLSNPEIAHQLGVALRTVKLYRQRAMEKLGVVKPVQLARIFDGGNLMFAPAEFEPE